MALFRGYQNQQGSRSNTALVRSGHMSPAEKWLLDPAFKDADMSGVFKDGVLFNYQYGGPGMDEVVIPKGRMVGVAPSVKDYVSKKYLATVTLPGLATGGNTIGMAPYNFTKDWFQMDRFGGNQPSVITLDYVELPYMPGFTANTNFTKAGVLAEDVVKYANCMVVKARSNDPNAFPQGMNIQGLYGKDPVAGYFCANATVTKCKRDDYGTVTEWQQETDKGKQTFPPEDVVHFYYKREKGNAYGTSFLVPVIPDVKALRRAEENILKMMYRNVYPFYHIRVGTEEATGTSQEVTDIQNEAEDMDVESMLVTTERVEIKPIASDKVIDAEPYLKYMESRVFSGLGIPEIMFGRGNTANRSTGDNMTSEMADRIRAIQRVIETFFNEFIIKELLMEGGYDPVLNPDQNVEFKFNDNDVDVEIKKQVHAIYKYEHSAITEDEMREEIGMDPIPDGDREKMFVELITRETLRVQAELGAQAAQAAGSENGNAETNNKAKNKGGQSSKKQATKKDSISPTSIGLIKDAIDDLYDNVDDYLKTCCDSHSEILQVKLTKYITNCTEEIILIVSQDKENTKRIENKLIKLATDLTNGINSDLIGFDIHNPANIIDIVNVRIDIFKDLLVKYLIE